ncbi:hypothetical protein [Vulcanisaeta souniana]|uniref:Thioredoxin-like fold domain-containing protein n=1 Tax=Vulcanisaeta souniana JCM 11219 TaxID=1293586 RepID=A0A830E540_9CREN|nr:hypothetical protein [Vulcanisaeta souniana]BDR91678.1 hypothetical protein Vsou_07710 [Vulcanisaeta souniana JCM 11219]GGI71380.1 hypothetical protein GCM10007112_05250 [Vulcanisaeta souniana JCM 11219]
MLINIRLYMIDGRDNKYLEFIRDAINEVTNELRTSGSIIRFTSVKINRDYIDIILGMLLGGEGPAEFIPIINELREYNVFDLPALIINGKKVLEGKVQEPSIIKYTLSRKFHELFNV